MDDVEGLDSGFIGTKRGDSMRRWIILWVLLMTAFGAFALWQDRKAQEKEVHTKALWQKLTGTDDVSSLSECVEKTEYGRDIEACLKIQTAIEQAIGR